MADKNTYNITRNTLVQFYGFVNVVARDIGWERVLGLLKKMAEGGGTFQGMQMKEKAPDKAFDIRTASQWVETALKENEIPYKLEETPQNAVFKVTKCSNYEAARMAMMDDKTIETICKACNIKFQDALFKQLNPKLSARVKKFRSTPPDDFCEEEIVLE
jgi:hypothetical protein